MHYEETGKIKFTINLQSLENTMKKLLCGVGIVAISALSSQSAYADSGQTDLEARIALLEEEINSLKSQVKSGNNSGGNNSDVIVSLSPTPKFKTKDGSTSAKIIGFMQADAIFHQDDLADHPDGTSIRRARLGIAGKFLGDWGYKYLHDFGNNKQELQDAFITYKASKNLGFKVGQFKEFIGLEFQTGSPNWTFMELPVTDALTPRRSVGASLLANYDNLRVNLGVFGMNATKKIADDEGYSTDLNVSYQFLHDKKRHFHVGATASYRVPDSAGDSISYKVKADTSTQSLNSLSTGTISGVDNNILYGLQALGIYGPLLVQGEYLRSDVNRENGLQDVDFSGHYIQAAYLLTGESRGFNFKKYKKSGIKPLNPLTKDGGSGAWELAARYENLDLTDNSVTGGEIDKYTFGLNWYPNNYLRLQANYSIVDTDDNATTANDDPQILALRSQVVF